MHRNKGGIYTQTFLWILDSIHMLSKFEQSGHFTFENGRSLLQLNDH